MTFNLRTDMAIWASSESDFIPLITKKSPNNNINSARNCLCYLNKFAQKKNEKLLLDFCKVRTKIGGVPKRPNGLFSSWAFPRLSSFSWGELVFSWGHFWIFELDVSIIYAILNREPFLSLYQRLLDSITHSKKDL